jgi:MFS transporter, SP family, solute carrier family 2 (myo-inositol transporter), member 13
MREDGMSSSHKQETAKEEVVMRSITHVEDETLGPEAPLISRDSAAPAFDTDDSRNAPRKSTTQSSGSAFLWILTCSACVSGLLFGYDTGVISGTLVSIGSDLSARPLTTLDKSLITSCTSLFALIASPFAGVLADKYGRKIVILIADALFTAGALWQALTGTVWGMIVGRSIVGLAIGAASLIVPLYISELAPSHMRGALVTVSLLFITGGQVVAYLVGWAFSDVPSGWRWMVGLGALPAIFQFVILTFMPETPRWLTKAGYEERAKRVLEKVYYDRSQSTEDAVAHTLHAIKAEILEEERASQSSPKTPSILPPTLSLLLYYPPHIRALTIACLLQGLQQLCGFNSLMYFSATIFSLLRFASPTLTSLSIAVPNFVATIAAFYLIDRVGRRKILLYTIPGMVTALLLCAFAFTFVDISPPNHQQGTKAGPSTSSRLPAITILISLLLYVIPYATGLGPVPWQQSELFPLSVRSLGSSLSTSTNWLCNFVVGLTFLPMMDKLTPFWTFTTYATVCAAGWVAVWAIYPETMGLDLEDVGELLRHGWGVEESLKRVKEKRWARRIERGREHLDRTQEER